MVRSRWIKTLVAALASTGLVLGQQPASPYAARSGPSTVQFTKPAGPAKSPYGITQTQRTEPVPTLSPVPAAPTTSSPDVISVQEMGKPEQKAKVIKKWATPEGGTAYQLQVIETGEVITLVEGNVSAGQPGQKIRAVTTRIFHWGKGTVPPPGAPVPPVEAVVEEKPARPRLGSRIQVFSKPAGVCGSCSDCSPTLPLVPSSTQTAECKTCAPAFAGPLKPIPAAPQVAECKTCAPAPASPMAQSRFVPTPKPIEQPPVVQTAEVPASVPAAVPGGHLGPALPPPMPMVNRTPAQPSGPAFDWTTAPPPLRPVPATAMSRNRPSECVTCQPPPPFPKQTGGGCGASCPAPYNPPSALASVPAFKGQDDPTRMPAVAQAQNRLQPSPAGTQPKGYNPYASPACSMCETAQAYASAQPCPTCQPSPRIPPERVVPTFIPSKQVLPARAEASSAKVTKPQPADWRQSWGKLDTSAPKTETKTTKVETFPKKTEDKREAKLPPTRPELPKADTKKPDPLEKPEAFNRKLAEEKPQEKPHEKAVASAAKPKTEALGNTPEMLPPTSSGIGKAEGGRMPLGARSVVESGTTQYMPVPMVTVPDMARLPQPAARPPQAPQPNRGLFANAFMPPQEPTPAQVTPEAANAFTTPEQISPEAEQPAGAFPARQQAYYPPMNPAMYAQARGMMPSPQPVANGYYYYPPQMGPMPYAMPPYGAMNQAMYMPPPAMQQAAYAQQPAYPQQAVAINRVAYQQPVPEEEVQRGATVRPEQLLAALQDSLYPSQRELAASRLAGIDWQANPGVVQALVTAARKDQAAIVRVQCLRSLLQMKAGTPEVVQACEALKGDADPRVQRAAEDALAVFSPKAAEAPKEEEAKE